MDTGKIVLDIYPALTDVTEKACQVGMSLTDARRLVEGGAHHAAILAAFDQANAGREECSTSFDRLVGLFSKLGSDDRALVMNFLKPPVRDMLRALAEDFDCPEMLADLDMETE